MLIFVSLPQPKLYLNDNMTKESYLSLQGCESFFQFPAKIHS